MIGIRHLCLMAWFAAPYAASAEAPFDDVAERIAAHFEVASSRLRPEEVETLERFVSRVKATPGAKLAVLVPIASEPARARFVAARVSELERRVQALAETAEYRPIATRSNADVLWLALFLTPQNGEESQPVHVETAPQPAEPAPIKLPQALTAPAIQQPAGAAGLRLNDWVIRGVKRHAQGPISAYVARTIPGALPHEVYERQIDPALGLVKEISLSAEGDWVVRTEIGWIGQGGSSGGGS